ncbi:MAG: glycosyltransferase family 39 protein [Labilithrix sp.]|nr:glycosyltransferase family 39 protein [Labilithrix sp.]MCW5810208.1 glycosyltransferase family 39 protein [Labilithrix sp.]
MALHLAFATRYGWFRDELYYVACGRRLALGYVDHPPLVALVARAGMALGGGSLVGLRLFAALAAAGTIVLAAELARTFGGRRVAELVAALATALAPYDLVVGHVYTMNAFEPLFWGGIALVVARALRDDDARGLVWLGPLVGLGVLGKHSASWPAVALAIGVALSPSRRLLTRREPWIAAAVAIVLVAPHVAWQVQHDFPTREFARAALSGKNEPYGAAGLAAQLLQLFHPLSAPLWIAGLVSLFRSRVFRPIGVALVLLVVLVFATQAKVYYLGPAWPWLFAAGGVALERSLGAGSTSRRRLAVAYGVLAAATALVLVPAAIPVLPVPAFQRYARALGVLGEQRTGEKMRPASLPQLYADMHGWPELAATARGVVAALSDEERRDAVLLASNYGEASALEHFDAGLPVGSGDNGWWLWGPPRARASVVVWVGHPTDALRELCPTLEEATRADHELARADERDLPLYVCRAPRVSLTEAWPRMKHYR